MTSPLPVPGDPESALDQSLVKRVADSLHNNTWTTKHYAVDADDMEVSPDDPSMVGFESVTYTDVNKIARLALVASGLAEVTAERDQLRAALEVERAETSRLAALLERALSAPAQWWDEGRIKAMRLEAMRAGGGTDG